MCGLSPDRSFPAILVKFTTMLYDRFAAAYDRTMAPLDRRFLAKWRAEALSLVPAGGDLLEVGAGTGRNFPFYPEFRRAVASEISGGMLHYAAAIRGTIEVVQADAESLPFADNSFDAAFATLVFCSIGRPEAAFRELVRCLRPNGIVVLLEHVRPPGLLGRFFDLLNVATVALIDDHFNRETAAIASRNGLDIEFVKSKAGGAVQLIAGKARK